MKSLRNCPAGNQWSAVRLEGITHKSLPKGGVGRSNNSNVVLTDFSLEIATAADAEVWTPIPIVRSWADHEQAGGDFVVANAIDDKPETGWALDRRQENRQAIFLVATPFGSEGGALKIRLKHEYDLRHKQFGRFRLAVTDAPTIYPVGSKMTLGNWHSVGPFTAAHGNLAFYQVYEPETKPVKTGDEFTFGRQNLEVGTANALG